ncbi:restriction endonuclease subunit S [Rhizobium sp. 1AS11]|uniref:restriction endonuclease subunit S n=1 Tax=Rhizobium acaciae TaxID=2989736 RepID=UPI002221EC2C|nr:restriction endonuclease subunit S [Rhizobium acaciae]MCW1408482.1 restriction endonuclease subunit S [Rhizobium acaciae]MCW1740918.1 restriction endonuclease subunit S [Rhizobium acaciae]
MTIPAVRLGDVVEIKGGGTPSKSIPDFWNGDIPWVSPKDMKSWEITDAAEKITHSAVKGSATNLIPANSILLVNRSGILKHTLPVGITRRPVAINQDIKALVCGPQAHPEYVAHLVKSAEPVVLTWVRATTADNFPIDNLRELEIPLPPLDEQKRIATILNRADQLRQKRRQAIALLDSLTQAIFLEMFGETASLDWPTATIGEVALDMRTGPFGSQLLHSEFVDQGVAVLGIDNAVSNRFEWGKARFITEKKYRKLSRYTVRPNDVLITIMGTCGRCAVVPDDIPIAINTKHLCCITLDGKKVLPQYLHACFLNNRSVLRQLGVQAKGAVMPGLNMGIIKSLVIPLPPISLQDRFHGTLKTVMKQIRFSEFATDYADNLFTSLQHRAFTGQL